MKNSQLEIDEMPNQGGKGGDDDDDDKDDNKNKPAVLKQGEKREEDKIEITVCLEKRTKEDRDKHCLAKFPINVSARNDCQVKIFFESHLIFVQKYVLTHIFNMFFLE